MRQAFFRDFGESLMISADFRHPTSNARGRRRASSRRHRKPCFPGTGAGRRTVPGRDQSSSRIKNGRLEPFGLEWYETKALWLTMNRAWFLMPRPYPTRSRFDFSSRIRDGASGSWHSGSPPRAGVVSWDWRGDSRPKKSI